jgi:hypothetical protein
MQRLMTKCVAALQRVSQKHKHFSRNPKKKLSSQSLGENGTQKSYRSTIPSDLGHD